MSISRSAIAVFCGLIIHASGVAAYEAPGDAFPSPAYTQSSGTFINFVGTPYSMRDFTLTPVSPPPVSIGLGNITIDSFFDVFFELSLDGGVTWDGYDISGTGSIHVSPATVDPGNPNTLDFSTQISGLDLTGPSIPGLTIRSSPTPDSLGQLTVTQLGTSQYRIDSFFDVFMDLSDDFGNTWAPSSAPVHINGIPEPESYAMLLAGLGLIGFMARRRSRPTAT